MEIESCFAYLTFPSVRVWRLGKVEAEAEAGGLRRMTPVNLRETNVELKKRVVGISRGGLVPVNMKRWSSFRPPRRRVSWTHVSTRNESQLEVQ